MSVPEASQLKAKAKSSYGQKLGPEADEYLDLLFKAVCEGWQNWQSSITFGGFMVNGAGVGAWAGTSINGSMSGSPYTMPTFTFKANSPQQIKFTQGLSSVLTQKFTAFPSSFVFSALQFSGLSGATPTSPGPVNASNIALPVNTGGSGQNPSGIASAWKDVLKPPDFDLSNPQCKSGALVDAIASTIEKAFSTEWLLTTQLSGCSLLATGQPGGSVINATSGMTGKLA